jgi:TonB family protein
MHDCKSGCIVTVRGLVKSSSEGAYIIAEDIPKSVSASDDTIHTLALLAAADRAAAEKAAAATAAAPRSVSVYESIVEREIKKNWRLSNTAGLKLVTVLEVRIGSDGRIENCRVIQSSERSDFDASAMQAVRETRNLPSPPNPRLSLIQLNFNSQEKK